jgi:hypothetical protein
MPPAVYVQIRQQCQETLRQYFTYVATPIEAPGKKDFGDVDLLVACPIAPCSGQNVIETVGEVLGAVRRTSGGGTTSFALPWPDITDEAEPGTETDGKGAFVQVDLHVSNGKQGWDWELFHQAHGDLWNMIGSTIRKYGLTVNNVGLYLHIEEIELVDRKKSLVLLTESPDDVLEFLGLDRERWWKQFKSVQDLFEYAASCRHFWAKDEVKEIDEDKKELKHNDRKRMNQRPVFRKWVEDFIPQCRLDGRFNREVPSRQQVRDEAFNRFGVKDEYNQRLETWQRQKQKDGLWRKVIKSGVPLEDVDSHLRGAAIRGLKAIIMENDLSDGVIPPKPLKLADGFFDEKEVTDFVESNWKRVGEIGLKKMHSKAGFR